MMGLEKDELDSIPRGDTIMNKYKDKITKLNEEPSFQEYMTKEEDDRKMFNTKMNYARKSGIEHTAKNMLKKSFDIDTISEITGLTKEEIKNLDISK